MRIVTSAEMRELDRLTIEKYGVPSLALMERAGTSVAEAVVERFPEPSRKGVLIVCGKGNNGGDGLVAARILQQKNTPVEVALLAPADELSPDAAHNLRAFRAREGKVVEISAGAVARLRERLADMGLVVDAILGTGMKNEVRGFYADVIALLNACGLPIVAVDVPSGLDSDRGTPLGIAIQAELTVALAFAKVGEVIFPGVDYCGDLVVADIGIDPRAASELAGQTELLERDEVRWMVPVRQADTHKGTYGHLLILAGSRGKTGAAILAARAAMRAGAGLVTLAAPRSLNDILAGSLVEVMTEPLRDDGAGGLDCLSDDECRHLLARRDALVFGPGIGVSDATRSLLRWLLRNAEVPWVIDADGLTLLASELERLPAAKVPPILTPHPGEMARLIGGETAAVNRDRIGIARSFAVGHRCHVVLKGARTVVATADGNVFVNPTGNPGMASGGMGDVLAGILGALLGQRIGPAQAMSLGVYLHGFVGDRVAADKGPIGILASDVIEGLPAGLRLLSATDS